jgi:hypothetical protein
VEAVAGGSVAKEPAHEVVEGFRVGEGISERCRAVDRRAQDGHEPGGGTVDRDYGSATEGSGAEETNRYSSRGLSELLIVSVPGAG